MNKILFIFVLICWSTSLLADQNKIFSIEQQSEKSIYQSFLLCDSQPHTGSFQNCRLKLLLANAPVENTEIFINGGMPQHQHGLPTSPNIIWSEEKKIYLIKGLKFSMPGLWTLNYKINATDDSAKDTIVMTIKVN